MWYHPLSGFCAKTLCWQTTYGPHSHPSDVAFHSTGHPYGTILQCSHGARPGMISAQIGRYHRPCPLGTSYLWTQSLSENKTPQDYIKSATNPCLRTPRAHAIAFRSFLPDCGKPGLWGKNYTSQPCLYKLEILSSL